MAKVQCACGRTYVVSDARLGRQVKCGACKRVFVAQAAGTAPQARAAPRPAPRPAAPKAPARGHRLRLGELAVARGMLSREALDACLQHLEAMRRLPGQEDLRLGAVLVSKRLLTRPQLTALLQEQQRGAVAQAVAAVDRSVRGTRDSAPVTEAQRDAIRRQMEAAAQQQTAREAAAAAEAVAERRLLARIRPSHVGAALLAVFAAWVVLRMLPAPKPQRVLEAYLRSCDEAETAPDARLATTDLGIAIREFKVVRLLPAEEHDYAAELAEFAKTDGQDWADLMFDVPMPDSKYEALAMLYPVLPDTLPPRAIEGLRVWVRPVLCELVFRQRGMGMHLRGTYRFLVIKAHSPKWSCEWRVAGYEPEASVAR